MQVLAGWWDVNSHILLGNIDPWWNPTHLTLYIGILIVIVAVWQGLRATVPNAGPIKFANLSGLRLAGIGSIMQIGAGIWNELVHHVFHNEPLIAPAHALLVFGMLTINLGMVVGLSIEYGMMKRGFLTVSYSKRTATLLLIATVFASIWLASAGGLIYSARIFRGSMLLVVIAFLLSAIAPLVLVPARRVLAFFGSTALIGALFNGVIFSFLVGYLGSSPYFPMGMISVCAFDLVAGPLNRRMSSYRAEISSSAILGTLFYATYFPFSSFLFPWSTNLFYFLVLVIASVLGGVMGNKIYSGLSSLVLGETLKFVG